jgi:hypothetical protein
MVGGCISVFGQRGEQSESFAWLTEAETGAGGACREPVESGDPGRNLTGLTEAGYNGAA